MNLLLKSSLICLVFTLNACGGSESAPSDIVTTSTDIVTTPKDGVTKPAEFAPKPSAANSYSAEDVLYPWVDQLNVRETPSTDGKRVGKALKGQPVTLSGEKTNQKETIVLRGVAYEDYWLKVTTKDKTEGWVFAGALKQKEEYKGNAAFSETNFDFPAFGNFDLKEWGQKSNSAEMAGDAVIKITTYQKDDQVLEISIIEMGEYGYTNSFKLMNPSGDLLKDREMTFEVDPENLIRETVTDYLAGKRYTRSQPMSQHFMQMNDRPQMVTGEWTVTEL